jgi:hypothetical protein
MSREAHVRFCESAGVRFPRATRLVVFGQRHLFQLLRSFVRYYHTDRCHMGLDGDAPDGRSVTPRPSPTAKVISLPRVGGLQHRYEWRDAA